MPIYEYCCSECGHRFEVIQRLSEGAEQLRCPQCGKPKPVKQMTACAVSKSSSSESCSGSCLSSSGFS